ncbi:hypothetical protein CTheo_7364 [Ceratobasidium theobromae]|uniref:2,5-diamino-6-ribosylamino-4(3H)-pyrimidinone 5'-phosphate reductase n=1 Tax=Ceratobasidium theobromae TaxID=1582974 RepID=A0A5N5QC31_9AGAM|nr:hypothetical protein CTheo_7364 [Ceratobasidium theobromae]
MSSSLEPPQFLKSVIAKRNAAPRTAEQQKRARVTLTYAQSLDAKIAGAGGKPLTISCDESMIMTHWLRTMHQGILVGIQTVINDDPQLNVRRLPSRDTPYPCPRPVILDSYLRTPPTCKLLQNFAAGTGLAPYIIYGMPLLDFGESKEIKRRKAILEEAGAILITGFEQDGQIDLAGALRLLKHRGINSVMIEGGQRVISSMLTGRHTDGSPLVDALIITVAPSLIGSDGVGVLQQGRKVRPHPAFTSNSDATQLPGLKHIQSEQFGSDTRTTTDFLGALPYQLFACQATIMGGSITDITCLSQLSDILDKAGDKLTVIDFHATWCGPCHAIAPTYAALAKEYTNAIFTKCDVDAVTEVAKKYSVSAMPTFIFIKNGKKIDQLRGADRDALRSKVRLHATGGAFSGKGQTLGSSDTPSVTTGNTGGGFFNIDPQMQLFLGLVGGYLALTYFFS